MATTLINQSQNVNDQDGYAGYRFRLEVIMNSYDMTNATYNVTINHYVKGDSGTNHVYHGLSQPNSIIRAYVGDTKIVEKITNVAQIKGSETLGGTWTGTIQANADGNLTVKYIGKYAPNRTSGYLPKTNSIESTIAMPTIPRYATFTSFNVNRRDETSLNVTWSTDVACDWVSYRIRQSGGSYGNWIDAGGTNFNISGLNPNTTYVVQLNVRRQDSQLWTTSGEGRNTTYAYPYCTASPNFVVGSGVTLSFYNDLNRTFTATVLGANDAVLGTYTGTATSVQMPNTTSEINAQYQSLANVVGGSSTYKVQVVYSSNTSIRDEGNTYSVDVNTNKPTFENFTSQYTANLTNLTNNNQTVINNLSTVTFKINANATAKNYATISKYVVVWGNATPQTITNIANSVNLANGSGNTIQVTAYDSRNLSSTIDVPLSEVVTYSNPTNLNVKLHRRNGVETTSYMDLSGTIYYNTFGTNGVQNKVTSIKYKVNNGATQYTISDISSITYSSQSATNHTQTFTIKNMPIHENGTSGGFDVDNAYTITAIVTDTSGSSTTIVGTLKDGKFAQDWYQDDNGNYHCGINGLANEDFALKVYGDISANNLPSPLTIYPVGSIYMSVNSTDPSTLFGGTWEQLSGYYLYAGNANTTTTYTGKHTQSTTLTSAQSGVPAHSHGASGSYSGANFYIRHGNTSGRDVVAGGTNTSVEVGVGSSWSNGIEMTSYNHNIDRVNIGGTVGVTVNNNTAQNASQGHTHNIATLEVYVWKRTA